MSKALISLTFSWAKIKSEALARVHDYVVGACALGMLRQIHHHIDILV
ncbi:hypothetical protein MES5069_160020 [Mesorhizobium escarrei]|uniref:Uncharacterized protein n=1 Tax=Mesorhizobium escarrei TaxID=666018 RepID=A0ABM9DM39_9HYPH|nr:hypothetical protein MES5069_160020 [Mesorhizobium escarrei]